MENQSLTDMCKGKSMTTRANIYEKKIGELNKTVSKHKNELNSLKILFGNSKNMLNFRIDESEKKMRNDISRLDSESNKNETSFKTEINKIEKNIGHLKRNTDTLKKVMSEILMRVENLEANIGPKS